MINPSTLSLVRELVERGLILDEVPELLAPGNLDRREELERSSWRVRLADGRLVRLLLAADLNETARRQKAMRAACPELVPEIIFHESLAGGQALADRFFDGVSLEVLGGENPDAARRALADVRTRLAATNQPSTEAARQAEWNEWSTAVQGLGIWTHDERKLLHDRVWPRLYPQLFAGKPARRWTNGDFTAGNVLVNDAGETRLVDCEFAAATHFFDEDAARFYALSLSARQRPDLYDDILTRGGAPWHLYFWLRQLAIEYESNSPAYLARYRNARLGVIRRLAEFVLDVELVGWSVEAAPVHETLEAARRENSATVELYLSGWCHIPGKSLHSVIATQGNRVVGETGPLPRSDVQSHFKGEPLALATGYALSIPIPKPMTPVLLHAVTNEGAWLPIHRIRAGDLPGRGPWLGDYTAWSSCYDPDPHRPAEEIAGPLFSILLPVYNPPEEFLHACLESVRQQHYGRWELCIVDDGSRSAGVRGLIQQLALSDPRVLVKFRQQNGGISAATNDALALARGDFIVLLDHDDILRPHALTEFAQRLQREPDLDALYSDEDKITPEGERIIPFFKPDFSPEFLLGVMYIGHALCVRSTVARRAGGFLPEFDGVQDYEFFLRVTEQTRRIAHIPRILYHWRQSPASSALNGDVKGDIGSLQALAVRGHLERRKRSERVATCGPHRLQLQTRHPPSHAMVRGTLEADPLALLREAARTRLEEILIYESVPPLATARNSLAELATVAARPDSALVVPLILSADGNVRESGWTLSPKGAAPVMRGLPAGRDGYHGSLICTREVALVSPFCFAVRRALVADVLASTPSGESWLGFCRRLRGASLFHRVCPGAWITTHDSADHFIDVGARSDEPDPFYNRNFLPAVGDYSLAKTNGAMVFPRQEPSFEIR